MEGGGGGAVAMPGALAWGFGLPHVPQNRQSTSNFVPQAGQDPAMVRVRVGVYLRRGRPMTGHRREFAGGMQR